MPSISLILRRSSNTSFRFSCSSLKFSLISLISHFSSFHRLWVTATLTGSDGIPLAMTTMLDPPRGAVAGTVKLVLWIAAPVWMPIVE